MLEVLKAYRADVKVVTEVHLLKVMEIVESLDVVDLAMVIGIDTGMARVPVIGDRTGTEDGVLIGVVVAMAGEYSSQA